MKKLISLFAAISMLSISAVAVQAEGLENYLPTDDDVYSFVYEVGADYAGEYYGMVAVAGTGENINTTNVENFVYIDQQTADATGKISFSTFAPKGAAPSEADYTVSTVFIGGAGLNGAQAIGILREANWTDAPSTIIISGKVIDTLSSRPAKIRVMTATGELVEEMNAAADGVYAITVDPAASYDVVLTKDGYLTFTYTGVAAESDVALKDVTITNLAGDVDPSGQIVAADLLAVIGDFGKSEGMTNSNSDIDASGQVVAADLLTVIGNFGKSSVTAPAEYATAE